MNIGLAVRKLRKDRSLSQEQLAYLAHTSKPNISNLERGEHGYSSTLLKSLAKAFGIRVSEIFALAEELAGDNTATNYPGIQCEIDEWKKWRDLYFKLNSEQRAALQDFLEKFGKFS